MMKDLSFELARKEHAKSIEQMRRLSALDLTEKLGQGHWSSFSRLPSIQERIRCADHENLRRTTLYVACNASGAIGSIAVSTFAPGFWKRSYWLDPRADALGVFNLVVDPNYLRLGVGRFLMDQVAVLARERHIPYVRLDAYASNPISNSFYRAIGYDERCTIDLRSVPLTLYELQVIRDLA